jgi:hypothetical protein
MEPEGSLPPSQEHSTGPYPEPDRIIRRSKLHEEVKRIRVTCAFGGSSEEGGPTMRHPAQATCVVCVFPAARSNQ